ncbi:MAG: Asp-tRNA(Asn)/Glu-tRNA(Gln) amidotransferase subunit GatC, partial [Kiloniellales bacterium]|nr:Asp-tRNA(Asn)/Glu-tRNA(Gln) amidotransferase subunit GatC [Kiloniellales bacterium]
MAVDKDTVQRIARLARIRITEQESEALSGELSNILDWVEQLSEVDTDNAPPLTSVVAMRAPQRDDKVNDGARSEAVLGSA